jgi:hypothetical protein
MQDILNRTVASILTLVKTSCQLTTKIYVSTQFKLKLLCIILLYSFDPEVGIADAINVYDSGELKCYTLCSACIQC